MPKIITTSSRKSKKNINPIVFGAIILLIAAGAFLYFRLGKNENNVEHITQISADTTKKTDVSSHKGVEKFPIEVEVEASETNESKSAESEDKPTEAVAKEKPKTPEELGLPIVNKEEKAKARRLFNTNTERTISGLANTKRGFQPPPLMSFPFSENLNEILNSDIVIYEDDDESTVAIKENCAQLKAEMKQYIADGGTPENFLSWYHNELSKDYNSWKESQQYIVQLMKEGMIQEAEAYMEKANEELTKAGIRNVVIPDNLRKIAEKKLKELEQAQ